MSQPPTPCSDSSGIECPYCHRDAGAAAFQFTQIVMMPGQVAEAPMKCGQCQQEWTSSVRIEGTNVVLSPIRREVERPTEGVVH